MRTNDPEPPCPPPVNRDRIMRENSTTTTYYLYAREDRIADYDQSGNILIAYTHGPGIDEPVAMTIDTSTYFYIPDVQGTIRAMVDRDGNTVATYQYDVWGNLISYSGELAQKNDYLYTGREYDWETGIYYYRARYYNPEIGRFLSRDPAGMVDGPNMYVYVKNDAVNGVDPSGMYVFEWLKSCVASYWWWGWHCALWVTNGFYLHLTPDETGWVSLGLGAIALGVGIWNVVGGVLLGAVSLVLGLCAQLHLGLVVYDYFLVAIIAYCGEERGL